MKYLPKEVAPFINLQGALCSACKIILNSEHYRRHDVNVPSFTSLLSELNMYIKKELARKTEDSSRESIIEARAMEVKGDGKSINDF